MGSLDYTEAVNVALDRLRTNGFTSAASSPTMGRWPPRR